MGKIILGIILSLSFAVQAEVRPLNVVFVSKCPGAPVKGVYSPEWDCFNDSQGALLKENMEVIAALVVASGIEYSELSANAMVKDCKMDSKKNKFNRAINCVKEEGLFLKGATNLIVVDPTILSRGQVYEYAGSAKGHTAVVSVMPGCFRNTRIESVKYIKQAAK